MNKYSVQSPFGNYPVVADKAVVTELNLLVFVKNEVIVAVFKDWNNYNLIEEIPNEQ